MKAYRNVQINFHVLLTFQLS